MCTRAASSYVVPLERKKERDGERKRGRWRKHGGGRETPCFDPRKRRRQSRRVLGSIPQGGRHSAALKPSVYPPSRHPLDPARIPPLQPSSSFYREPPTDLPHLLLFCNSPSLSLTPFALHPECLAPLSLFLPPSVAILSLLWRALRASLSTLAGEGERDGKSTLEAEARS